jgi:hypothetical protein
VPAALAERPTVTVQEACSGILALLSVITSLAALSVAAVPVHVVTAAGELAMVRPDGSVSVSVLWVRAKALVFDSVIVNVEAMASPTLEGENACDNVGAEGVTESAAGHGEEPALVGARWWMRLTR